MAAPGLRFDGETFDRARDGARLTGQLRRVYDVMQDGQWHTIGEIANAVLGSEAAVSARLRDLRKPRFGGYRVERQYVTAGLWMYRVVAKDRLF